MKWRLQDPVLINSWFLKAGTHIMNIAICIAGFWEDYCSLTAIVTYCNLHFNKLILNICKKPLLKIWAAPFLVVSDSSILTSLVSAALRPPDFCGFHWWWVSLTTFTVSGPYIQMTGYIMKSFWTFKNMDKLVLKLFLCSANEAICLAGATTIYTIKWNSFLSGNTKPWTNTFENYSRSEKI